MRSILAALAVGLFSTAAHADGDNLVTCFSPDDLSTNCPVNLVKGNDYIFYRAGDGYGGKVELVNPLGIVTISFSGTAEYGSGQEFRAAYAGTYFIRLTPTEDTAGGLTPGWLDTDCRGDNKTKCSLPLNKSVSGVRSGRDSGKDFDSYAMTLRGGQTYTLTCAAGYARLDISDQNGRVLVKGQSRTSAPGVLRFRPRAAGKYFFSIGYGGDGNTGGYTVSVK